MITLDRFQNAHLPHRKSILEEYITNRSTTSRPGFNCYIDSALITIRSFCGLLGFEIDSRKVTDMANPNQPTINFRRFPKIVSNLERGILITSIQSEEDLHQIPEWKEMIIALNAANKCVAHFDEYSDLEHKATPEIVETAAKAILRELSTRVKIQDQPFAASNASPLCF